MSLPTVVWATAWVSFFADVSTELIYGVLPAYYLGTLSLSIVWLGVIEGGAETLVSLTKLFSGSLSDRTGHRKVWMLAGYGLSTLAKPLLALTTTGVGVGTLRGADRLGKGVRGAPRDALVGGAVDEEQRGRAFGVQRSLDHAGALVGGLLAAGLLAAALVTPRDLFVISVIPGAIAVLIIALFVRETAGNRKGKAVFSPIGAWRGAAPGLRRFLLPAGLFALANSSDMLLLALSYQRFVASGMSEAIALGQLPLLWALLHVVRSAGAAWGGSMSDRVGRLVMLRVAWGVYALAYAIAAWMAAGGPAWLAWVVFAGYGMHAALGEGPERALIADLETDPTRRGTAYGLVSFLTGLIALPATVLTAWVWQTYGGAWAFGADAAIVLVALAALGVVGRRG